MAVIFDIQRCSLVDGDGIRTAVFFKGCNLNCKWCHNPEGISSSPQLLIYKDRCVGCKRCADVCENLEKCILCGKCAEFCEGGAREICGKEYSVDELISVITKDKPFYDASGGGVTFSGGECMLQIDFLSKALKKCKENGINTAVDTAGNVPFKFFERIIPYVDTYLYDVKCVSEELHINGAGVSNTQILENLKNLSCRGCNITVRVPIIGGFNDTDAEIFKIKELLSSLNIKKVELLPYHNMGEHKCDAIGRPKNGFAPPSKERMDYLRALFSE